MSQQQKSPVTMIRIERYLSNMLRGLNSDEIARKLMEQGWIDIDWAADYTRRDSAAS